MLFSKRPKFGGGAAQFLPYYLPQCAPPPLQTPPTPPTASPPSQAAPAGTITPYLTPSKRFCIDSNRFSILPQSQS